MNCEQYYRAQAGGSLPLYSMQTGSGIFSNILRFITPMFKSAARAVAPVAKRALKSAGKNLLTAGTQMAMDGLEGHDFKESAKRNLKEAAHATLKSVQSGKGRAMLWKNTARATRCTAQRKSLNRARRPHKKRRLALAF